MLEWRGWTRQRICPTLVIIPWTDLSDQDELKSKHPQILCLPGVFSMLVNIVL